MRYWHSVCTFVENSLKINHMNLLKPILINTIILLFSSVLFAQEFKQAVKYRNMANDYFAEDDWLSAAVYYDSAAYFELQNQNPYWPFVAECYDKSGTCLQLENFFDQSVIYYNYAMRVYQFLEDQENASNMLSNINDSYDSMISEDMETDFQLDVEKQYTNVHFRVSVILQESNDSTWVLLDAGSNDGLFVGAKGEALGVWSEDYSDRGNMPLGKAEVMDVYPNYSYALVNLLQSNVEDARVMSGDMIRLPAILPVYETTSIFYRLALLNIDFLDINEEPLYHPRHLFYFDSEELEELMLLKMKDDIFETAEMIKPDSLVDPRYTEKIQQGRFKGLHMIEAMEQSSHTDIKYFLEFVESFPGKYMGNSWKINETYATWVINDAPVGSREMKEMLMGVETEEEFIRIMEENLDEFVNGDFYTEWDNESDELAKKGYFEEALQINRLLFLIADLTEVEDYRAWAHFDKANILEYKQEYEQALIEYDLAKDIFKETDNLIGESYCVNNIAHVYTYLGDYETSLRSFEESYALKLQRLETDRSESARQSIGRSLEGKGQSLYNMGQFQEAFDAFSEALGFYKELRSVDGFSDQADMLGWLGKVSYKMARYDTAIHYYDKQLNLYRDLGDVSGEADAIDNLAYTNSLKGDEKKANELYQQSYELKLSLDDKDGAGFSMSNVGQTYWTLGEYEKAIEAHSKAISLRIAANNRKGQAYSWKKLGSLYSQSGDPKKALDAFDTAAMLYAEIGDKQSQGDVYTEMGGMYYEVKDYILSLENYSEAKKIYMEINSQDDYASVLASIGDVYYAEKKYDQSKENYLESIKIQEEINDRSGQMYNLINVGQIYHYYYYQFDTAEIYYRKALEIASEINSITINALCLRNLADLFSSTGDYDEATLLYEEALAIYSNNGLMGSEAEILISLGFHFEVQGDFISAEQYFNKASEIAKSIDNRNILANALSATGGLKRLLGEFDESLAIIDQSIAIRSEGVENPWGLASAYISYGNTLNSKMDYQNAIKYYLMADSIYKVIDNDYARATPINNIGTIYFGQHDYEKALNQFMEALNYIDIEGMEGDFLALVKANIGEIFYEMKDYDEAERWLEDALEIAYRIDGDRRIGITQLIRGKLYTDLENWDQALSCFDEAKEIFEDSQEKEMLEELYLDYGILFFEQELYADSKEVLQESMKISEEIGSNRVLWKSLYHLALNQKEEDNLTESIYTLKEAVNKLETVSLNFVGDDEALQKFEQSDSRLKVYEEIVELLILQGKFDESVAYLDKANSENMKSKFGNLNPTFHDDSLNLAYQRQKDLKTQLDQLSYKIAQEKAKPDNQKSDAKILGLEEAKKIKEGDYRDFLTETIEAYPNLGNYFEDNVNPKDFMKEKRFIPEDFAAILYLIGKENLYLFVATHDSVFAKVLKLSKSDLENQVLELLELISRPSFTTGERGVRARTLVTADDAVDNLQKFNNLSEDLYNVLIKPVADEIVGKEKLVIIPNGILYYIPFQILGYPANDSTFRYLIEDYEVLYTSELTFKHMVYDQGDPMVVAVGNADSSLTYAEVEVNEIKNMYPETKVYVREEATRDKVINIPENYNILHLATHGILDYNDFDNSYLMLAADTVTNEDGQITIDDGKLSINDIYRIPNLGIYNMVILSACETAVSFEMLEGWPVTTASAFLDLGVVTVIASLWSVDDEATHILMKKFYENLKTMGKLQALRTAQLDLIHDPHFAHPYFWAPFLLIGDWR